MFEKITAKPVRAVAEAESFNVDQVHSKHQLTVATTDSAGALVTAGAGTFAIQFRVHKLAALETLRDSAGDAITIDATDPQSVEIPASIAEVVVTPAGVTTATHYRAIIKSGH